MYMGIILINLLIVTVFCVYFGITNRRQQDNVIDLYTKINKLETRVEELESSVRNLSVKDNFSIGDDGTIIRKK
jgi:cell division protein FtsL